jgi:type IV secretory pathway VirB10-like protein
MSGDDDFDDFLARRKPLFRPAEQDLLEPPDSVDRIVLRQAREAIHPSPQLQEIRSPGWGMPLALAATLVVAFTVVLNVAMPKKTNVSDANFAQVAQRRDEPAPKVEQANRAPDAGVAAAPAPPPMPAASPPESHAPAMRDEARELASTSTLSSTQSPPNEAGHATAKSSSTPAWRRDSQSWLAEINRLRAEGKTMAADAEMAEYKRQHRAYATSPDR